MQRCDAVRGHRRRRRLRRVLILLTLDAAL